jgi:hypothetical protein
MLTAGSRESRSIFLSPVEKGKGRALLAHAKVGLLTFMDILQDIFDKVNRFLKRIFRNFSKQKSFSVSHKKPFPNFSTMPKVQPRP